MQRTKAIVKVSAVIGILFFVWFVQPSKQTEFPLEQIRSLPDRGQISIPGKVESVHDGDTLTVVVSLRFNVRLIDCWAKELNSPGGIEARDALASLVADKNCTVQIPLGRSVGDSFSFGRVLGRVSVENQDVSEWMVQKGHATKTKK